MSESFGAAALRHAGLAARTLGWTPDVFWAATPSDLVTALAPLADAEGPPDRATIDRLIERDAHVR